MRTLIVFSTRHGTTEKAALKLQKLLGENSVTVNLKRDKIPDLSDYDAIAVGGSIHAGQIQKRIKSFCTQNEAILLSKKLGLFLCCMEKGDKKETQFNEAYSEKLRDHARTNGIFGGEFNFQRMNFLEKAIVKKVAKISESVSNIDDQSIQRFASELAN